MTIDKIKNYLDKQIFDTINLCNKKQLIKWLEDVNKELDFIETNNTQRRFLLSIEKKYIEYKLK